MDIFLIDKNCTRTSGEIFKSIYIYIYIIRDSVIIVGWYLFLMLLWNFKSNNNNF